MFSLTRQISQIGIRFMDMLTIALYIRYSTAAYAALLDCPDSMTWKTVLAYVKAINYSSH